MAKPDKIYLNNNNLMYALQPGLVNPGTIRETFFQNQLSVKHKVDLPQKGDFIVDDNYIFEGSQGLLLDQHIGFFPNVTRANVGIKNIKDLININTDIYLVTRAYQTRHGNGFMTNTDKKFNIKNNPFETNVFNKFQGNFRKSMLDLDLIEYAINKEEDLTNYNLNLVITCLDHLDEFKFTYRNEIYDFKTEDKFLSKISEILSIRQIYSSNSKYSKNIKYKYFNYA